MEVLLSNFDEAMSWVNRPLNHPEPTRFSVFEAGGTDNCLLDCPRWQKMQEILSQRRSNTTESKEKRKERTILEKETIRNHRQALPAGEPHSNSELKRKRKQFALEEILHSVENGCGACRYYHALLEGLFLARPDLNGQKTDLLFQWDGPSLLSVIGRDGEKSYQFQFFSPSGARNIIKGMHSANLLPGDTSSLTSFGRATEWIRECEVSHQYCGVGRNISLPSRLLDLELPGQQDIKLVETGEMTGTYACLSHCWGKDPMPVKTTAETFHQHTNAGISWDSLPKTFQDAVTITRRLGIRYLWIDSLCIIQDSVEDWQAESGKMADIYRNSYITIAAVSSSDFRGGCFSSEKLGDLCFETKEEDGIRRITPVAIRDCKGTGQLSEPEHIIRAFPLLSRAWVYQERMLSRRVLYCNQSELQLECREGVACECGNRFMPPHPHPRTEAGSGVLNAKRKYADAMKKHGVRGRQYSPAKLSQHWQWVVMQYSRLRLTYPSDILPALSGCAKDIGQLTGDRYLAGMWRTSLAEELLWTVNPPITYPRPAVWRAPSWSWASVLTSSSGVKCSQVLRTRGRDAFQTKIVSANCQPIGSDPTGAVSQRGSYIEIKSRLCPTYIRRLCRQCAKSRHKYTIEHEGLYHPRYRYRDREKNPDLESWRSRACRFVKSGLDLRDADVTLFPDFKYDDRTDFDFFDALDGRACKLAGVFILHLYDGQSFDSAIVTDFFLVLRGVKQEEGGSDEKEKGGFERVALATITFGTETQREAWFRDVYERCTGEERQIRIV